MHSGIGSLTPERKAEIAAAARAVTVSAEAQQAHPKRWSCSEDSIKRARQPAGAVLAERRAGSALGDGQRPPHVLDAGAPARGA